MREPWNHITGSKLFSGDAEDCGELSSKKQPLGKCQVTEQDTDCVLRPSENRLALDLNLS